MKLALRPPGADRHPPLQIIMNSRAESSFNQLDINDQSALVTVLDDIEMYVMRELLAASPLDLVRRENLRLLESRDGVGALMYFNRWMRLGVNRPATPRSIESAIAWLRSNAGLNWSIDLSPLAEPSQVTEWLTAAGLRASDTCHAILWRDAAAYVEDGHCDYEIRELTYRNGEEFDIVHREAASGWKDVTPIISALVRRPGWRSYVVFDGSKPVACSAMFVACSVAWRGISATVPTHRGRGAHAALVAHMTRDALDSDVRVCMAQTVRANPGIPAKSERNLVRAGFRLSHLRVQYVPV